MKKLDLPPLWLVGFLVISWGLARFFPQTVYKLPYHGTLALIVIAAGLVLMGLAISEMKRAKTTLDPHENPSALVTTGIFRRSRNPMYLATLLLLGASVLWWGSISALLLLWIYPMVIRSRFINVEEDKLRENFGTAFDDWSSKTKRWL